MNLDTGGLNPSKKRMLRELGEFSQKGTLEFEDKKIVVKYWIRSFSAQELLDMNKTNTFYIEFNKLISNNKFNIEIDQKLFEAVVSKYMGSDYYLREYYQLNGIDPDKKR